MSDLPPVPQVEVGEGSVGRSSGDEPGVQDRGRPEAAAIFEARRIALQALQLLAARSLPESVDFIKWLLAGFGAALGLIVSNLDDVSKHLPPAFIAAAGVLYAAGAWCAVIAIRKATELAALPETGDSYNGFLERRIAEAAKQHNTTTELIALMVQLEIMRTARPLKDVDASELEDPMGTIRKFDRLRDGAMYCLAGAISALAAGLVIGLVR